MRGAREACSGKNDEAHLLLRSSSVIDVPAKRITPGISRRHSL